MTNIEIETLTLVKSACKEFINPKKERKSKVKIFTFSIYNVDSETENTLNTFMSNVNVISVKPIQYNKTIKYIIQYN